ncbi:MAG: hypothetical protein NXI01_06105 [Gammaproteobacteria bacterium]|nr:hypothetical protein [Gammaproteobacteria bacterium]
MSNTANESLDLSGNHQQLIAYLLDKMDILRSQAASIQAQPIGMMRVALNNQKNAAAGLFLHVWQPGLPLQETGGPFAHTHVFHLKSRVIKGSLKNINYEMVPNQHGSHNIVSGICKQEYCVLEKDTATDLADMNITEIQEIHAGEVYDVPKGIFHKTVIEENETVITLMQKSEVEDASPLLAIPKKLPISLASFDRNQLNQETAWERLIELLKGIA